MADHAKLAPSSAHRWLECHGSIALCATVEDTDSVYAREGTFAHDIAAKCLNSNKDALSYLGIKSKNPKKPEHDGEFEFTEEMAGHINAYVDFIDALKIMWGGEPLVETRVRVSEIIWGTADIILLSEDGETVHIVDLKYGQGHIVSAELNYQALCYAIGAINHLEPALQAKIKAVHVHIFQPRAGGEPWREWETTMAGVESAREKLLYAETMIRAGSTTLKTGGWCKFCDASAICPARAREAREVARDVFSDNTPPPVETLSVDQISRIIELTPRVEEWLKAVHDLGVRKLERGEALPGYKLVNKIGNRKWTDEKAVSQTMQLYGVDPFTKPKLVTVAEAERRTAKAGVKLNLTSMVERPVTGQALVPMSDKRSANDAIAVFPKN